MHVAHDASITTPVKSDNSRGKNWLTVRTITPRTPLFSRPAAPRQQPHLDRTNHYYGGGIPLGRKCKEPQDYSMKTKRSCSRLEW